jgi:hypothetical protein
MGFLSDQLVQENFQDHRLKTLKVICKEKSSNPITKLRMVSPVYPSTRLQ